MRRRENEVNTRTRVVKTFFFELAIVALVLASSSCGGRERHAERMWRQAIERVEKGDTQGGVDRLQLLIDQYPDSQIATKAREQIVVYRGLLSAVESYPLRRAREVMVPIARAIERYRRETGRAPATLAELVPGKLAEIPNDPWGHPFVYESSGRSYHLRCQDQPLQVVDGEFRPVTP